MFFDLPRGTKVDKYLAGMPTTQWLTWTNPRNEYSNAIIMAAGGGGASSGLGGGSGGLGHIYCPLSLLPDTLYIQVGLGGSGGAGSSTYIGLYPSIQPANLLMVCNGGGYNGAAGGTVQIYNTYGVAKGYQGNTGAAAGQNSTLSISPIYAGSANVSPGASVSSCGLYPNITGAFVLQKPFTVFGGAYNGAPYGGLMGSGAGGVSAAKGGDGFVIIICY